MFDINKPAYEEEEEEDDDLDPKLNENLKLAYVQRIKNTIIDKNKSINSASNDFLGKKRNSTPIKNNSAHNNNNKNSSAKKPVDNSNKNKVIFKLGQNIRNGKNI